MEQPTKDLGLSSSRIGELRPRSLSKRTATGKMVFVPLLAKGDLRQWFAMLEPQNGVLGKESVYVFVNSLCDFCKIPVPKAMIDDVLESGREIKFHEFVMLALMITRPVREKRMLELDEELRADDEESTSEASSDEEGGPGHDDGSDGDSVTGTEPDLPQAMSPLKKAASLRASMHLGSPVVKRIRSRLRAGSVRKEGKLQYVNFVTKKDTQDWFRMNAPSSEGSISPAQAKTFFVDLASSLRLEHWKEPLDELMGIIGDVKYAEFVRIFLEVSRYSREKKSLQIDDELAGEEDDSTSEGSENDEELRTPRKNTETWCPPFVDGQAKVFNDLHLELISSVLSYVSLKDLMAGITVCKRWYKACKKFPPYQWKCAALYYAPKSLAEFREQHKMVTDLTFMRQFPEHIIDSVVALFPNLEHLQLSSHSVPKGVGEFKSLKSLQAEGSVPPTLIKHLSASSHRTLVSLDLSRDASGVDSNRAIPGMTFIKEFGQLRTLKLSGCKGEGLNYILQNSAMMTSLDLGFMAISNIHCQLIGGNMFHLRSLVLRSTEVTDDGLYEIGLGCKKLEQVFLENCKQIGAQGVVDLIANCTLITALKLAGCTQLRDDTVFALSSARNLQELDVQMLEQVTPKAWYILASKCIHIRIFHAWGCALTEEVISKFHRRCIVYHSLTARSTRAPSISTPDWKSSHRKQRR